MNEKPHKSVTIVINGREVEVEKGELTYADVVALAFDTPPANDNTIFTITYRRGEGSKPEGMLVAGDSVKVKNGMIFNVTRTDKS